MTSPVEDDWIYLVEATEPHPVASHLYAAVDVALERAMKERRLGLPVTRHVSGHNCPEPLRVRGLGPG